MSYFIWKSYAIGKKIFKIVELASFYWFLYGSTTNVILLFTINNVSPQQLWNLLWLLELLHLKLGLSILLNKKIWGQNQY